MPKLLVFAPCEKAIIDEHGNATLIILMQNVGVQAGKEEIPKNAVTPKEWAVFALWEPLPEDYGKTFVQVLQTLLPDGSEFKKSEMRFQMQEKLQQNRMAIMGFPVGQVGRLTLNMWLEVDSVRVGEVHSYCLTVSHIRDTAQL